MNYYTTIKNYAFEDCQHMSGGKKCQIQHDRHKRDKKRGQGNNTNGLSSWQGHG